MNINEMNRDQLEVRISELKAEIEKPDSNLEEITSELEAIEARKAQLLQEAADRRELRERIASGEISTTETKIEIPDQEERKMMDVKELRNSNEYIKAFANYVKTGNDSELRMLLTANGGGDIAVPEFIESTIRTAWERHEILARVTRTYIKGNLKIGFEYVAGEADIDVEGETEIDEEDLELGYVELIPETIKKWISISDEVMDLDDGTFLQYIYDEFAEKIADKLEAVIVEKMKATTTSGSTTSPAQGAYTGAATYETLVTAASLVRASSDKVVIMNPATYAQFKVAQANANFGFDIFDGMTVIESSALDSYASASDGEVYAIVADVRRAVHVNFTNGDDVIYKFDDTTLATKDLIRVIGRLPAAVGIVSPKSLALIKKPTTV